MKSNKKYMLVGLQDGTSKIIFDHRENVKTPSMGGTYWSISSGHDTECQLRLKNRIPDEPCKICDSPFSTNYFDPVGSKLRELNVCFHCNHWTEIAARKSQHIIVNHRCYRDGGRVDKATTGGFLGFGGAEWIFKMNNGRVIDTNNLWCQGTIPERFYDILPDNAIKL